MLFAHLRVDLGVVGYVCGCEAGIDVYISFIGVIWCFACYMPTNVNYGVKHRLHILLKNINDVLSVLGALIVWVLDLVIA